jgi:hypothetical protein
MEYQPSTTMNMNQKRVGGLRALWLPSEPVRLDFITLKREDPMTRTGQQRSTAVCAPWKLLDLVAAATTLHVTAQ